MRVISTGKEFRIYSDHLKVYEQMPSQSYIVRFNPLQGFFLEEYSEIEIHEDKIYGIHLNKVSKAISSFKGFKRNLGIILSGDKGIGKSLYAKLLSKAAIENGYPLIVIDEFIPGIASYLETIEQEVVVLFDEFDKMVSLPRPRSDGQDNSESLQSTLLTLLDGISAGKKLYVITCNSLHGLSDYFINRPGRFHYHFRFDYPSRNEIQTYLQDKISEDRWGEISKVTDFGEKVNLNYDCLRAIAFEIQSGESFEDAIQDLNIVNLEAQPYKLVVHFSDSSTLMVRKYKMDLFNKDGRERTWLYDMNGEDTYIQLEFSTANAAYDSNFGCSVVSGDK